MSRRETIGDIDHSFYEFEYDNLIFVADRALESLRADEQVFHDAISGLTAKHIKAAKGLLGLLPYNPELYPAQRLDVVEVRPKVLVPVEVLEGFANEAYKGFPKIAKEFVQPAAHQLFSSVNADIHRGEPYIFAFDHGRIFNTPLGEIAVLRGMHEAAKKNNDPLPGFTPRLTISKLISRFSAMRNPAVNLLGLQGVLDLSIPPSGTIKNSGIDDKERQIYNSAVKAQREQVAASGVPVVDFMSPSGTADKLKHRVSMHPRTIHMGPIASGTAQMLCSARVVPIALNVNNQRPRVAIGTIRNPARSAENAQSIMIRLAELGKTATGIDHVYHQNTETFAAVSK